MITIIINFFFIFNYYAIIILISNIFLIIIIFIVSLKNKQKITNKYYLFLCVIHLKLYFMITRKLKKRNFCLIFFKYFLIKL